VIAVIMDTETTNLLLPSIAPLASQPRIIEFGAMKVDSETQTVLGEVSQLLYPGFLISDEITKITKITREDLDGKPVFKSFVPTLIEFFTGVDLLVAHNLGFDADMLANELSSPVAQISRGQRNASVPFKSTRRSSGTDRISRHFTN